MVGTRIFSVRYRVHQVFIPGTALQCAQQLEQKTPQYLWHVFVKRKQSVYFEDMKENGGDQTVICQIDYAENFTIHDQDQIQSAHWSLKQVSIFTSFTWFNGSGGQGQSFGLVSNSTKHNKFSVITCLEILAQEIISIMPDVNTIKFFSDGAASQFKNRFLLQHLTTMMEETGIEFEWNYFASSHGKGVVDGIGGTLKRLVWMENMAGVRCSSAKDFVDICNQKTKTIIVGMVQQAQFDTTEALLVDTFKVIPGLPEIQKQHHVKVLHKDVIEYAKYSTSTDKYVFKF